MFAFPNRQLETLRRIAVSAEDRARDDFFFFVDRSRSTEALHHVVEGLEAELLAHAVNDEERFRGLGRRFLFRRWRGALDGCALHRLVVTEINTMLPSGMKKPIARIDDFQVGQHASFTKTFTEDDLRRFIEITGDVNPLHVDEEFARATQFGGRVLQGMLTASILSTMVGMMIPGTGAIYRSQMLKFLRPVHIGETVTAHFVVRAIDRAKHRLEIESWIENANGERVIEGTCEAGILRA